MKPCPFCGSKDIDTQDTAYEFGDVIVWYQAVCKQCGATGPVVSLPSKGILSEEAEKLWNNRVGDSK